MPQRADCDKVKEAIELSGGIRELALKLKVSYDTVGNWKHGRRAPTIFNALKIEKATEGQIKAKEILPDYPWDELRVQ